MPREGTGYAKDICDWTMWLVTKFHNKIWSYLRYSLAIERPALQLPKKYSQAQRIQQKKPNWTRRYDDPRDLVVPDAHRSPGMCGSPSATVSLPTASKSAEVSMQGLQCGLWYVAQRAGHGRIGVSAEIEVGEGQCEGPAVLPRCLKNEVARHGAEELSSEERCEGRRK